MDESKIRGTLEKQLQLLSERSKDAPVETLCKLTEAMVQIVRVLIPF